MKKSYIYGALVIVVLLLIIISARSSKAPLIDIGTNATSTATTNTSGSNTKGTTGTKSGSKQTTTTTVKTTPLTSLPTIDFIDKQLSFAVKDFPNVKFTITRVIVGRGDSITSTSCSGIPNPNLNTYFYPGGNICIDKSQTVDGAPIGLVSVHVLVENNSALSFGGNGGLFKLHYIRSDSTGKTAHRFGNPISDLSKVLIKEYTSKEVVLTYSVPQDQLVYDFVANYQEPALNTSLSIYPYVSNAFLINFNPKSLTMVK